MSRIANSLVFKELREALNAVDAPFNLLPDVKNKDGDSITDIKEKRLALVRQHVQAAGEILNLATEIENQAEMAVGQTLMLKYKDVLREEMLSKGVPPEALAVFDNATSTMVGEAPYDPNCNCPACAARREQEQKNHGEQDELFGFAAGIKRKKDAEERREKAEKEKAEKK